MRIGSDVMLLGPALCAGPALVPALVVPALVPVLYESLGDLPVELDTVTESVAWPVAWAGLGLLTGAVSDPGDSLVVHTSARLASPSWSFFRKVYG